MKFATIMREANVNEEIWSRCSKIKVNLYNDKGQMTEEEDVRFVNGLFDENLDSYSRFVDLVDYLDANSDDYESIDIQITADHVIVFYKTPNAAVFRRTPPIDFD